MSLRLNFGVDINIETKTNTVDYRQMNDTYRISFQLPQQLFNDGCVHQVVGSLIYPSEERISAEQCGRVISLEDTVAVAYVHANSQKACAMIENIQKGILRDMGYSIQVSWDSNNPRETYGAKLLGWYPIESGGYANMNILSVEPMLKRKR